MIKFSRFFYKFYVVACVYAIFVVTLRAEYILVK